MDSEKLPFWSKVGFGVGDLGGNLFFTLMSFWLLNYLTDTVGLAAGLAGLAVMIGRIWDALMDPLVGYLSDNTRSRWGRRRPYLFWGSFLLFIMMVIFFVKPDGQSQQWLFWWAVLTYSALFTCYTLVNIPYSALTPELARDYNNRTELNGYRMSFAIVGTLIAAGAALPLVEVFSRKTLVNGVVTITDKSPGFLALGIIFGLIMVLAALTTFFSVREPKHPDQKQTGASALKNYLSVFKNGPYLLILFPWVLNITGVTVLSGMMIYYFKYFHKAELMTTVALLVLLLTAIVTIPLWVLISSKIGKKIAYILGMLIVAVVVMVIYIFGKQMGMPFLIACMAFLGVGFATGYVFPWSIVPDTMDYDFVKTGIRKEGVYYGIWTFFSKIGQALAGLIIGVALQATGYQANIAEQNSQVLEIIRLLIGPIGGIFYVLAILVLIFYPIGKKEYEEIAEQIKGK